MQNLGEQTKSIMVFSKVALYGIRRCVTATTTRTQCGPIFSKDRNVFSLTND